MDKYNSIHYEIDLRYRTATVTGQGNRHQQAGRVENSPRNGGAVPCR